MSESNSNVQKDSSDLLAAAHQLATILGLNAAQAEALINGKFTSGKTIPEVKERPVDLKKKEYIHIRSTKCSTCTTTSVEIFSMTQLGSRPVLLSTKLTAVPAGMKTKEESFIVQTCPSCKENLLLLTKDDLVALYLAEVQKGSEKPVTKSFDELEAKFQELHPAPKKKELKDESEE